MAVDHWSNDSIADLVACRFGSMSTSYWRWEINECWVTHRALPHAHTHTHSLKTGQTWTCQEVAILWSLGMRFEVIDTTVSRSHGNSHDNQAPTCAVDCWLHIFKPSGICTYIYNYCCRYISIVVDGAFVITEQHDCFNHQPRCDPL